MKQKPDPPIHKIELILEYSRDDKPEADRILIHGMQYRDGEVLSAITTADYDFKHNEREIGSRVWTIVRSLIYGESIEGL